MITLTERAREYLQQALQRQGRNSLKFGVKGGGCAGFSYYWEPADDSTEANDFVMDIAPGYHLIIDVTSQLHVIGSTIDYVSNIIGSQLVVNNPLAKSSCGCGESFYV